MRLLFCLALVLSGCGRLGYLEESRDTGAVDSTPVEDSAADSAVVMDGSADTSVMPVNLPGEAATFPAGTVADVWVDFSADYTFIDVQYLDVTYPMNNRPHHMVLLSAPFEPGIGLVGTWEIWEVRAPATFVSHFYYPGTDDGPGPDALFDAAFCDDWMGDPSGLCVASGSQNGGDGVYRIEADWSIRRISPTNNVGDMAYDASGAFDGIGTPTLYWSGPNGLRRFGEPVFYSGMLNGAFTEILPSGDILTMHTNISTGLRRLVILAPNTYTETVVRSTMATFEPVARQHAGVYATVAGDVARLGGFAYAIAETRDLLEIDASGGAAVIASAGTGWRWTHAIVPPASHPLGVAGPALYMLEYNPATEVNRIIRIELPLSG